VDADFERYKRSDPDRAKLHDVFSRLEFASLMQEFLPAAPPVERDYRIAASAEEIRAFADRPCHPERSEGSPAAGDSSPSSRLGMTLSVWFEPTTPDTVDDCLMAASLSVKPAEALIVPIGGECDDALKQLLQEDRLFVAHDAKLQQRRLAA